MKKNIDFRSKVFLAWGHCKLWQRVMIFLFSLLICLTVPSIFIYQKLEDNRILNQTINEEQQKILLLHQQLKNAKTKQQSSKLTPYLARQLLPIDQFIFSLQQQSFNVHQLEWQMAETPQLTLIFSSSFRHFDDFLQHFLHRYPLFQLISLHVEKERDAENTLYIITHWQLPQGFLKSLTEEI